MFLGQLLIAFSVFFGYGDSNQGNTQKETPVIILRDAAGRTLTTEDLRGVTGTFRYEVVGSSNVPREARSLHEKAREAGGKGNYKKCIELLEKASVLAPQWPYPVYDRAYTHLLMKDFDSARRDYDETVRLSPRGFFTAITALDILRRKKGATCQREPISLICLWSGFKTQDKRKKLCVNWLRICPSSPRVGKHSRRSLTTKSDFQQLKRAWQPVPTQRRKGCSE
jgi:tetratricopeptide (TPR) repeat protein